jgi:hypothetical protein
LAILKSTRQGGFFAYWLSNFCGGRSNEVIFQLTQIVIEPIGRWGFEKTPKAFHRIEFRTVGLQRQQPNIGGQTFIVLWKMKAGLVLDDDM